MGTRLTLAWFTLTWLFAATSLLAQQQTGEVRGRITSSRGGQPLALVQVQLSGTSFRTVTADDGTFSITGVPLGNYTLQAVAVDYYMTRQEFALAAGEIENFDIVLASSAERRRDTADVTAGAFETSTETSASAITIEGQERKNLASVLADDPLRAVQALPGVTSNNDFSSEFSLRGAPFSRIGLYLDGVLLHSPFHTTDGKADDGSLTIFNGDATDEMTLYEGAWPVRYSDRTAGILDVETREGNRQQIQGRASASASNAALLFEGPLGGDKSGKDKRGSWLVAFRKSYLQYILNRIDFGDQAPLSFGFTDGQARLTYDIAPRHTIGLSYVDGSSGVDRTPYRSELGVNSVLTSGYRFTLLDLSSRYTPNQRVEITNRLAWTRERGDVANRDYAPLSKEAYGEWTWHGDASVIWSENKTLEFGGVFRRLRQDGLTQQFVYTPELVPSLDIFRGTDRRLGAYVQQSFGFDSGKIRLTAGVRTDSDHVSPVQTTSPYANIVLQPWSKTRIQVDWGQYAQFPELNEFFSTFALGRLLPQRATHYEAAVEHHLNDRTRLRVEFYNRQDRDLLARPLLDPRILSNGMTMPAIADAPLLNSQRGYARGAQIFLQRRTANGFTGWISYAYGRAVIRDGVLQVRFPSDYDQRSTFNGYLSRRVRPTVNVSARFTYGSGMPLPGFYRLENGGYFLSQSRNALRAPAYERTDLRLNKAYVHKKTTTTLFAEVVNVTNRHNRDFDSPGPYDPVTGRTYPNFFSMFPILPSAGMMFEF